MTDVNGHNLHSTADVNLTNKPNKNQHSSKKKSLKKAPLMSMPFKAKRRYKGATKRCVYRGCKSDSRFKRPTENYSFIRFPQPCLSYRKGWNTSEYHIQQCQICRKSLECVRFCQRVDGRFHSLEHVTKDKYICTLHTENRVNPFPVCQANPVIHQRIEYQEPGSKPVG